MADLDQASSAAGSPPRPTETGRDLVPGERADEDRALADNVGLTDEIIEASAQARTAKDVAALLGDRLRFIPAESRVEFISNVQATLRRDGELEAAATGVRHCF